MSEVVQLDIGMPCDMINSVLNFFCISINKIFHFQERISFFFLS